MIDTFFTDRDLGLAFPRILKDAGIRVERHVDHFKHDAPDEKWIAHTARRRWIALTHNERIRYTPNELRAVERHSARLLIIKGKGPFPQLADSFVRTIDAIRLFTADHRGPYIAKVHRATPADLARNAEARGRIDLWWSANE